MSPILHCACVCILDCLLVCLNWPLNVNFKWAHWNISREMGVPDDSRFRLTPSSSDQKMPQLVQTELLQIIIELLWYSPPLIFSDHENWGSPLFQCWHPLFLHVFPIPHLIQRLVAKWTVLTLAVLNEYKGTTSFSCWGEPERAPH